MSLGGGASLLGDPGAILEWSWAGLGASLGCLGSSWAILGLLGSSRGVLGRPWGGLGGSWGCLGAIFRWSSTILGWSWGISKRSCMVLWVSWDILGSAWSWNWVVLGSSRIPKGRQDVNSTTESTKHVTEGCPNVARFPFLLGQAAKERSKLFKCKGFVSCLGAVASETLTWS